MTPLKTRLVIGASIVASIFIGAFIILRLTGVLQIFRISSGSSEPNIKAGALVLAVSMKTPQVNDFICFSAFDSINNRTDILMHRLCGKPGDKVEIKDGVLILNGVPEKGIILNNEYLVPKTYISKIPDGEIADGIVNTGGDSVRVFATGDFMKANGIAGRLVVNPVGYADEMMTAQWHKNWNTDQFGPIVVPPNSYFVLGDNRHNAYDSRYRGFIPLSDLSATVVWHR